MSTSIDFKTLWNRGAGKMPDVTEIFAKANRLNRTTRKKIWIQNMVLLLTAIFIIWVWVHYQPRLVTTKIGIVMVVLAIVSFSTVSYQQLPLLADADVETDSRQYLTKMIRIKRKQEFLGTTMMTTYFILLTGGLALYMPEYISRASIGRQVLIYGLTFAWMLFSWFYSARRAIKKQRRAINEIIERLEAINGQLEE